MALLVRAAEVAWRQQETWRRASKPGSHVARVPLLTYVFAYQRRSRERRDSLDTEEVNAGAGGSSSTNNRRLEGTTLSPQRQVRSTGSRPRIALASLVSDLSTAYNSRGLPTTASDAVTGESITYTHDAMGNLTLTNSSVKRTTGPRRGTPTAV